MFKKIIVDKAINQVSVRYNIKVNKEGDYIRQYPNSIGMFKKIIVDKAINQVSVRYNIKVNKEKQSSRCLNDDCSDKTIYRAATRCEYEHALNKLHGCLTNGIRFLFLS